MHPAEARDLGIGAVAPAGQGALLRWLVANLVAERERWALWVPVGVGTGVGLYFWLTVEPPFWLGPAIAAAAMIGDSSSPKTG